MTREALAESVSDLQLLTIFMITQGQEDGSERWNRYRLRRGRSIRRGDGEIDAYVKTGHLL